MSALFLLDGKAYDVFVPTEGLKRSFQVLDGENTGRTLAGVMFRDIIGTYYNYEVTILPRNGNLQAYDSFYEVISAPTEFHTMTFPYGQETLTFQAYVASGQDAIKRISNGKTYWTGLSLQFVAKKPQRT